MTKYGRSPWLDRFPRSRLPDFPGYRGQVATDVVIVGGGMTGCATAYACAAAGVKVVLLEASRVGRQVTASSAGWVADEPGVPFLDVEKALGRRAARKTWNAWRRAALDFAALLRRLDITCDLTPRSALSIATTAEQSARLKRERRARREAGIDAPFLAARVIAGEVAIEAGGIRGRDGATVDPFRACLGLVRAAAARGALVFERSPVSRITFGRRSVEIFTAAGSIRAGRVVIATGFPTPLIKALIRHFWFRSSFLVLTERLPAPIRRRLGAHEAIVRDGASPPHVIRWVGDDQLLVMGADMPSPPPRRRDKAIVQRTGQLMYELSTVYPDISGIPAAYGWDAPYARGDDGLPYVGPHRNFPHHLFAFGDASHSLTGAYLASRILLRHILEEVESSDEVFGFARALVR